MSSARGFYGPGGPYAAFAGRDATIALAKSNMEAVIGPKDQILGVESLTEYEVEQLKAWETKLQYVPWADQVFHKLIFWPI